MPDFDTIEDAAFASPQQAQRESTGQPEAPVDRRQAAIVAIGRRALSAAGSSLLVEEASALVAESLEASHFSVAEVSPDATQMRFSLIRPAVPSETIAERQSPLDAEASLAARAIRTARQVVVGDLALETNFADELLCDHEIRSAVVCPLLVAGRALGALGVYSTAPERFTAGDALFAESISHLIATTIARRQAESALAEASVFRDTVLDTVDALVIVLSPEGHFIHFNRACHRTTGFTPREVKDRQIWSAFLVPQEVALVRDVFARLHAGESPVALESFILTKLGRRRRIAWVCSARRGAEGELESILATGVDITRQWEMEQELTQARADAAEANQALDDLMARVEERLGTTGSRRPGDGESPPFQPLPEGVHSDRRKRLRRSYPYVQRIAPMYQDRLPRRDQFEEMRCRDISASGFSFLSPTEPDYDYIVVALGVAPLFTYLAAEVRHSTPVKRDGRDLFLVGCTYTGRLAL